MNYIPAYIETYKSGKLDTVILEMNRILESCTLCPRNCHVNRLSGEKGICQTGFQAQVASYAPHHGEEPPLSGIGGSGTIFFSRCNLCCCFCQNYDISFQGAGVEVTEETLSTMMLQLQGTGCHNINFVTPTHVIPQILSALKKAIEGGLSVPLVYNSSGFDNVSTLKQLEGIIDIYLPDFKFWDPDVSERFCQAEDYPERARMALLEMHRQVGDLVTGENNVAEKGVILRHLVMPDRLAGTEHVMKFVAEQISTDTCVNIMSQYRPCGDAYSYNEINRPLSVTEYHDALKMTRDAGINRLVR